MNKSIRTTLGKIALAAATVFSLAACNTAMLWSEYGYIEGETNPVSRTTKTNEVGKDNVIAFARVKPDSKTLPANSLMMMGEKYWYVLDKDQSAELAKVLNAPLSQRFMITNMYKWVSDRFSLQLREKNRFEVSPFCLAYELPDNAKRSREEAVLKQLGFQEFLPDRNTKHHYSSCFSNVAGTIYRTPQGMQPDYRFEQSIPVILSEEVTTTEVRPGNLLLRLAATPLAVAADVVTFPFQLAFINAFNGHRP